MSVHYQKRAYMSILFILHTLGLCVKLSKRVFIFNLIDRHQYQPAEKKLAVFLTA